MSPDTHMLRPNSSVRDLLGRELTHEGATVRVTEEPDAGGVTPRYWLTVERPREDAWRRTLPHSTETVEHVLQHLATRGLTRPFYGHEGHTIRDAENYDRARHAITHEIQASRERALAMALRALHRDAVNLLTREDARIIQESLDGAACALQQYDEVAARG